MDKEEKERKKSFSFYDERGQSYSLDWSFFNRKKRCQISNSGKTSVIPCPNCKKGLKLICHYCNNSSLISNPIHTDELICPNCDKITSSIYCTCGFKLTTPYLQKKLKAVKRIMRDGDYREYLAIFVTIIVYAIIVLGIISIGSHLNTP